MTGHDVLRWLERTLIIVGVVLATWCAMVLIEARRTRNMPVPPAPPAADVTGTTGTLPGDGPSPTPRPHAPVAAGAWVARLDAPTVNLRATVLEGSDDATLERGAGHIEDTAFPGDQGNVGIAGHRDTTFRPLRRIKIGDPLAITTPEHVFHYRVTNTAIVGPDDVYVLDDADHPTVTLVTCYPFEFIGHAPKRFIVSANLVGTDSRASAPDGAGGSAK